MIVQRNWNFYIVQKQNWSFMNKECSTILEGSGEFADSETVNGCYFISSMFLNNSVYFFTFMYLKRKWIIAKWCLSQMGPEEVKNCTNYNFNITFLHSYQKQRREGWDLINQFNTATFLCLSQAMTLIYNVICCGIFCSLCWY